MAASVVIRTRAASRRRTSPVAWAVPAAIGFLVVPAPSMAQPLPTVPNSIAIQAFADEMPVHPIQQTILILKCVERDRNFEEQVGDELRVGIVHRPEHPASVRAMDLILPVFEALSDKFIRNVPISYTPIPFTSAAALEAAARDGQIDVFYITPGNSESIDALLEVGESLGILTTTGVPDYVEMGVALGIGTRAGDADSPQVLINLQTSRSEGANFHSSLLRVADVIR